jgi:hypothetical protein
MKILPLRRPHIGPELLEDCCPEKTERIAALEAENAALDRKYRTELWAGHGHSEIYGDDGEMQCCRCGVDYRRDDLSKVEQAAMFARTERATNQVSERDALLAELKTAGEAMSDAIHTLQRTKGSQPGWERGSIKLLENALAQPHMRMVMEGA